MRVYTHVCANAYACRQKLKSWELALMDMSIHMSNAHVCTHAHTNVHAHVCVHVHTHLYTHVHTHVRTHDSTHLHACFCLVPVTEPYRGHWVQLVHIATSDHRRTNMFEHMSIHKRHAHMHETCLYASDMSMRMYMCTSVLARMRLWYRRLWHRYVTDRIIAMSLPAFGTTDLYNFIGHN